MATHHEPHPCLQAGPCTLCKQRSFRYTLFKSAELQEKELICEHYTGTLSNVSCICQACMKQVKRNVNNENFHPRWLGKQPQTQTQCCILNCNKVTYSFTSLLSPDQLKQVLDVSLEVDVPHDQLPLCQSHYNEMYRGITGSQPCDSCGVKPRKGEYFVRHCPSPGLVNIHLNNITDDHRALTNKSNICLPCYKYINSIVQKENMVRSIDSILVQISERKKAMLTRRR